MSRRPQSRRPQADESAPPQAGAAAVAPRDLLRDVVLPALVLVVLTLAVYAPVARAGFLWDDDGYVTKSDLLESPSGLRDIWFRLGATTMYAPATFTTFWLGYQLWGLDPLGYHLVNLALHVACVLLLWRLLRRLALPGAWLAAALFAVHPVMVESVAWVAELKNMQSGLFALLALLAWLRIDPLDGSPPATGRARAAWYGLALLAYTLALLSKALVVALPPVVLVLVWWKRGRITRQDLLAVAPMLALGLAAGLTTIHVEREYSGAEGAGYALTLAERTVVAGRALWFYAGKLVWPADLMSVYPRWEPENAPAGLFLFPLAALALLAALAALRTRIGRGPLAAALAFGLLLAPMVGFFNVAYFMYSFVADHFQYHAAPALFALAAAGVATLRAGQPSRRRRAIDVGTGLVLLALALLAARHVHAYRDEKTRCRHTIARNGAAWSAMYNLGVQLKADGDAREALRWYREALRITPRNPEVLNNAGVALFGLGETEEALRHYREALRLWPEYALARNNLGTALASVGDHEAAIREVAEAVRLKPDYAEARANLAQLLAAAGRLDEAEREYRELARRRPRDAAARHGLGLTLVRAGRHDEAIAAHREALRLAPDDAAIRRDLAGAIAAGGDPGDAIRELETAVQTGGDDAATHHALARARVKAGELAAAERELETALRLDPGLAAAHNDLGTLLASQGRLDEALGHYREAVRLRPAEAEAQANLGTAAASAGRLDEAVAALREAVRLAPRAADYRDRLGVALAQTGRLDEAIVEFEQAISLDPRRTSARENLDLARRERGDGPDSR